MKIPLHIALVVLSSLVICGSSFAQVPSWSPQDSNTSCHIHAIHFTENCCDGPSDVLGWLVGSCLTTGVLQHSFDEGISWYPPTANPPSQGLNDAHFLEQDSSIYGWAVGTQGTVLSIIKHELGLLQMSANSSITGTSQTLNSVHFVDINNGWAVGDLDGLSATIIHTNDGGASWEHQGLDLQYPDAPQWFNAVFFSDASNGWAAGLDGRIFATTNGGDSWEMQLSGVETTLNGIFFIDAMNGWITGNDGLILHTTNGGAAWQVSNSNTTEYLHAVHFTDALKGWVVGNNGTILHTSDAGSTWTPQQSFTTNSLRSVFFMNEDMGWAAGLNGIVVRYTSGSTSIAAPEATRPICTVQPNPFSDRTTFVLDLPTAQHVDLRIRDITGRYVTSLVNAQLAPSLHRIIFDGSMLANGIYTYRLQIGDQVESGKIVLEH